MVAGSGDGGRGRTGTANSGRTNRSERNKISPMDAIHPT